MRKVRKAGGGMTFAVTDRNFTKLYGTFKSEPDAIRWINSFTIPPKSALQRAVAKERLNMPGAFKVWRIEGDRHDVV